MSVACPNGHQSETDDYCDQCGARIGGPAPAPTPAAAASAPSADPGTAAAFDPAATLVPGLPPVPAAHPGEELCPLCNASRIGDDRFCEGCGYDFTAPPPPVVSASAATEAPPGGTPVPAWEAIAIADRDYFDRVAPEGVTFPQHCPPRSYVLSGEQIRIGRHSNSRGIQPEVDLSGAPEDSAISHLHCILLAQPDGTYSLVDPGSTNGTTLNDDPTPVMANIAVALADGDRIHLGAWTTITVRATSGARRPASP